MKRLKYSCYYTYLAMSSVFSLPPILFLTFRELYGISYTLLGTLVLINFSTQLLIDLIFTFFAKHFHIRKTICVMPLFTSLGLMVYALVPHFFPQYAYIGLAVGTVIFSVAAGLCEVLLSPLVAAIPSEHPEKDMSTLHSLYAYGVLTVVVISTVFLKIFGREQWMYLTLFWAMLPILSFILFSTSPMPKVEISHQDTTHTGQKKRTVLLICVLCIFFGSASENAMTNWISGYMEKVLHVSKVVGDILGMALFAVLLGLTRSVYAKYGKNIIRVLLLGMIGATACYLVAGISSNPLLSMLACILTGLATSMLWPGTLIMMEERLPGAGVTAYALMAAAGDFGGSVAPQMLGFVTDHVAASSWAKAMARTLSVSAEEVGMKAGMLTATIFPLCGMLVLLFAVRYFKNHRQNAD